MSPPYPEEHDSEEEEEITPEMFSGDGGEQMIQYLAALFAQKRKKELSKKRKKGMPPYSQHISITGQPLPKISRAEPMDETFHPCYNEVKSTRGRGVKSRASRGRGRGRGRGLGSANPQVNASPAGGYKMLVVEPGATTPAKSEHWKENQLTALVNGCNHLKPVLKGRFKHYSYGVELKKLAWEEVRDFVNSTGRPTRSVKQCQDKIAYWCQKAKKRRQNIDSKYRTGSGRREDQDYLTELEQAACDYSGEDVTLGIQGMQPPDIMGNGSDRPEMPWSSYEPNRDSKEDYAALYMPSVAMKKTMDKQLLDDEDPTLQSEENLQQENQQAEEEQYNGAENEVDEDIEEEGQDSYMDSSETAPDHSRTSHNDIPARISRTDMLAICDNLNMVLGKSKMKQPVRKNPATQLLATESSSRSKTSLLTDTMKAINKKKEEVRSTQDKDVEIIEAPKESTSTASSSKHTASTSKTSMNRTIRRTPSFSKIILESSPDLEPKEDTVEPPPVPDPPKMYTAEEVQVMMNSLLQKKPLNASTPTKLGSPEDKESDMVQVRGHIRSRPYKDNKEDNHTPTQSNDTSSAIKEIRTMSSKKGGKNVKKSLFSKGEEEGGGVIPDEDQISCLSDVSPESASVNESIRKDIIRKDRNAEHLDFMENRRKELLERQTVLLRDLTTTHERMTESTQNVTEKLMRSQERLTESHLTSSDSMSLSLKTTMLSLESAAEKQAQALSSSHNKMLLEAKVVAQSIQQVQKETGETSKLQVDRIQDSIDGLSESTEKLVEHILKKEVKMVQCLNAISDVNRANMEKTSEVLKTVAHSNYILIESQVRSAEAVRSVEKAIESMALSMEKLAAQQATLIRQNNAYIEVNELLHKSQERLTRENTVSMETNDMLSRNQARSAHTLVKVTQALQSIVTNLHDLGRAQERLNREQITRGLVQAQADEGRSIRAVRADESHDRRRQEDERIVQADEVAETFSGGKEVVHEEPNVPEAGNTVNIVSYEGAEPEPEIQLNDTEMQNTSAYLTHPDPVEEGEEPTYQSASDLTHVNATFLQYALPAASIMTEDNGSQDSSLPTFSVLNRDEFLIVQNAESRPSMDTGIEMLNTLQETIESNSRSEEDKKAEASQDAEGSTEDGGVGASRRPSRHANRKYYA